MPELSGAAEPLEITDPELLRVRDRSPQIRAALEGMGGEWPELLLRLDRPAPGVTHVFIMPMGDQTMLSLRFFLYGDRGAAAGAGRGVCAFEHRARYQIEYPRF